MGEISEKITQKNNNSCSQFPVLTNSAEYGIVYQKDFFDKNIAINTDNYYVVHTEDFVYNPRISKQAPYGPIRVNHLKTGVMSPLYYIFKIKDDFNIGFFEFLFIGNKWHKFMYQNGDSGARSDRYAIKDKVFNKLPIYIPQKIEEQKLIFEINHKINSLLYLQQRKLELISALEKGLGQIIKQQNNKYGITFSLNNFLEIPPQIQARIKNKNQLLTVKLNLQGIARGVQRDTLSLGSTKYFIRHTGELIFGKQNIFNGSIALITKEFDGLATSNDVPSLKISNINPQFLFYLLKNPDFWKHTELIATGTGSKRVHIHDLLKLHIKIIPDAKYQAKIVSLSRNFEKIVLNQQIIVKECEKTKQFLLQNLFI
ncbi:restriction endonuclease subunit S [Lactobacillus jensenii]|uniref:restriction endonuclease subunit S n=1 Tax=Lactobacillus jensenii TaxID=109790 RepID=UPI0022AC193C|nr:restriction endonuclease subunit S [Lactobacillus jensenii]MCZ3724745.1 restriction endonuclease subunit S [Lactobacillus jensenii]MCZ3726244.1 restriction endonuclease subunit S [Lactobacillus jensenii]MCZ3727724.1 restriction endonuclease subunit S [Lactobacillus jensenii]MCZ3729311.1 restriction endonuclease subunit S [Lactobacillus jensenii]MCZ3732359.1 restriction endonuclease subunit S [Lactobacillus jensenii]